MGVHITDVQLDVTFTNSEATLLYSMLYDFILTMEYDIVDRATCGIDVETELELLKVYQELIYKISKHCNTVQE